MSRRRVVLKVGGAVAGDAATLAMVLARTHDVCVVHGAGPQISAELERCGLEVRFVQGRRVTSPEALVVVRKSLAAVNASICRVLRPVAVPLFGDEIGLAAERIPGLGLVGSPLPSRPPVIEWAFSAGLIPVVAPLGMGPLNVNADEAASALAVGLGAERLIFATDVPGVLLEGEVATSIGVAEAERMLDAGEFGGGIVPKLRAAVGAAREGVEAKIGATAVLAA